MAESTTRRDFVKQLAAGVATFMVPPALSNPALPEQAYGSGGPPRNLFIMGWDGAGLNNVRPMLENGSLVSLRRFINREGGKLCPLETLSKTNTVTGWTQYFTGLTYDQSGIIGNDRYGLSGLLTPEEIIDSRAPESGVYRKFNFWVTQLPYEQFFVRHLQDAGFKIGWVVSKHYLGRDKRNETKNSPFKHVVENVDFYSLYSPMCRDGDPDLSGDNDDYIFKIRQDAVNFIKATPEPWVLFVHTDPDYYGHRYGEKGKRYLDEFERSDNVFGRILSNIDLSNTNVIVTADHGFDEGKEGHQDADDLWMVTNLPVHSAYLDQKNQKAFGTMRDLAPTVLSYYGIDYSSFIPRLRGKSLLK